MLPEHVKSEILSAVEKYEHPRHAALEVLLIAVEHLRWISDETLINLADLLGMSPEELDNRATFYNHLYRMPVGKHVILVCDSVTCWIMGFNGIRDYLCRRLEIEVGQTTSDDLFTLLPIQCLGACDKAPVMMIDGTLHTHLNPERIDEILSTYGWDPGSWKSR